MAQQYISKTIQLMQQKNVTFKVQLLRLEAQFQSTLKFQVAIARMANTPKGPKVTKIDKTSSIEVTHYQPKIKIGQALSLPTTLPIHGDKQVDLLIQINVDGRPREELKKSLSLRQSIMERGEVQSISFRQLPVTIFFRSQVIFEQGCITSFKTTQVLQIQEEIIHKQNGRKQTKQNPGNIVSHQQLPQSDKKTQHDQALKKYKSTKLLKPVSDNRVQASQLQKLQEVAKSLKSRYAGLQEKYDLTQNANKQLQKNNKQLEKRVNQLMAKVKENSRQQGHDSQRNLAMNRAEKQLDHLRKQNLQYKRQIGQSKNQIASCRQQLSLYKNQIKKLQERATMYQQSTKNIALGSQTQTKQLRQQLRHLERKQTISHKERQSLSDQVQQKDRVIAQLKTKIKNLQYQNVDLSSKLSAVQERLKRQKQGFQRQQAQLQQQIQEIKQQRKKVPTMKDIKEQGEWRKKAQTLEKLLQKKQQMIRKMSQMKRQQGAERKENQQLRTQISELKQKLGQLQKQQSQNAGLQARIKLQQTKKLVDSLQKTQKTILKQRQQLQSSNKQLRQQVVRNKTSIANILNLVQQTGDQKLIGDMYSMIE